MTTKHYFLACLSSLTIAGTAACGGGGSPTSPGTPVVPASGFEIAFTNTSAVAQDKLDLIRRELEQTYDRARQDIAIDGLRASVEPGPRLLVPGWGVGGRALGPDRIELGFDENLPDATLVDRLPSVAAHEFHHAARFRGPGYGDTLLEAMISEGLADHYALELFGQPPPPWAVALSDAEYATWLDKARPLFDSKSYSHSKWFFGTAEVPQWAGYTIGFRLVADHLGTNAGATAASLTNTQADTFRPD